MHFWSRLPHALPHALQHSPAGWKHHAGSFKPLREEWGQDSSSVTPGPCGSDAFRFRGEAGGDARWPAAPQGCFMINSGVRGRVKHRGCHLHDGCVGGGRMVLPFPLKKLSSCN